MTSLKDLGEDSFIQQIIAQFPHSGIGDDCAVIPPWLITTDALVEGVHFIKDQIPPQALGYKTVAINVSDIAAMGGKPLYAFLAIALPSSTSTTWLEGFMQGIKEACEKWAIELKGGDTVGSQRDLFINLTLIGQANKVKYRHQAERGDTIYVTGPLGNSGGGLKALQKGVKNDFLIHSHYHPEPSIEKGIELASLDDVHAMMDISDGLDIDLRRLLKASQKGAILNLDQIPLSRELTQACVKEGWDPLELALTGGEDYCLLVTAAGEINAFPIGTITDKPEELMYLKGNKKFELHYNGFNHWTHG